MSEKKELSLDEDVERVLARLEAGNGYRSSPQLSPELVARLQNKLSQLYPVQAPTSQNESILLRYPIQRIYSVIHRAYDLFGRTQKGDAEVDVRKIRVKPGWLGKRKVRLEVYDTPFYGWDRHYLVAMKLWYGRNIIYHISRCAIKQDHRESIDPNECINIRSSYFKIDSMPPPDFVRALRAGGAEPELRKATLNHLLSLPEILGPYLDQKEMSGLA